MKFENILNQMKYENSKELEEAKKVYSTKGNGTISAYYKLLQICI